MITTHWQEIPVHGADPMKLFIARPADAGTPAPVIIVLQEIFGVNDHIQDVASRFAELGYVAVAPELFHRAAPGFIAGYTEMDKARAQMQLLTNDGLEADLQATHDWIKTDNQSNDAHVAAVGFCLGGKVALMANAKLPLAAAVSFYGGLPDGYAARQHGPAVLFWGGADTHIDLATRNGVAQALRDAGKPFAQIEFSEAGHGYFCEQRASYHAEAARQSWAMLVPFLQHHLYG